MVTIEGRFKIPRISDEYWDNRKQVLVAVSRAIDEYNS